eukprot:CAMPEP_0118937806 /NCGR_PEP_ID=MMETSP1169-20130426/23878_1 /TAXON_ID=36882 /ORGANISM="Pyramimonas obovata, Strain CCMP722" /LENGTH=144 /DNA_ID=CAMNT_0006881557 /DNA_START=291 /DNA_END=725 /DNA_ORIENTATION=-
MGLVGARTISAVAHFSRVMPSSGSGCTQRKIQSTHSSSTSKARDNALWLGQATKRSGVVRGTRLNSVGGPDEKELASPLSCWMDEDEDGMMMMCCGELEEGGSTHCKYPDPGCLVLEDDDGMPVFVCTEAEAPNASFSRSDLQL